MREPTIHSGELLPHGQDAENQIRGSAHLAPAENQIRGSAHLAPPASLEQFLDAHIPPSERNLDLLDDEGLLAVAHRNIQTTIAMAINAGRALKRLKAHIGHGNFLPALADGGISPRRAQLHMAIAEAAESTPDDALPAFFGLTQEKFALLGQIDPDERRQLAQGAEVRGVTLEVLDTLSPVEVRKRFNNYAATADAQVRRLQAELKNSSADLEIAESTIERLERQLQIQPRARTRLPASVVRAREESAALGTQALAALDDFAVLIETIHEGADLDADAMKAGAQRGAAASNLFLHLIAVRARAELLLARMQLLFSAADLPASPEATWPLDEDEAQRILAAREQFLIEHRAAKAARDQQRIDAGTVKRGRGRPKKQG